jgi:hypothetical protein
MPTVNFFFQTGDGVDLWLTEDSPDYQPIILESNQNKTFTVKNVELKTVREKKRKTKNGKVTWVIVTCSFVLIEEFLKIISTLQFSNRSYLYDHPSY